MNISLKGGIFALLSSQRSKNSENSKSPEYLTKLSNILGKHSKALQDAMTESVLCGCSSFHGANDYGSVSAEN